MKIFRAAHVLPISTQPIADGAVAIESDRIIAVGRSADLISQYSDAEVISLGEAAILPGFVNCHSHLEVSALRGMLDSVEHEFSAWLLRLTELRKAMTIDDLRASALLGAREAARAGVTCLGDIGRFGDAGLFALKTAGLRGIVYQETEFSPDDRTAEADMSVLMAKFEHLRNETNDLVTIGLSPHAPYTVSSRLLQLIADRSIRDEFPISIHAAESVSEDELLQNDTGFFKGVYEKFEVDWTSPGCSAIRYLDRLGVLNARPLLAHCVTVDQTDIELIRLLGVSIAHCPKSNAKFGHGTAPFEAFLDAGIAVGLGSDSVASNNVCDLIEEGRFAALAARNRPGLQRMISADEVLAAATLGGARALGMEDHIGSLEAGKQADLAVVSLREHAMQPVSDVVAALVFSANARDVVLTMVAGREVYRRPDLI